MKAEKSIFAIRHLSYSYFERERGDIIYEECIQEFEELETKATAYDTKEVQDAIECDRIERKLIELVGFIEIFTSITIKTLDGRCRVTLDGFKQHKEFLGQTKLEALTKALEWVE